MKNSQQHKRRFGMTSVEMAMLMPILIALLMGTIEMGNMFSAWMTVQKAAQSGARFAATGIGDEEGNRAALIVQETEKWLEALSGDKEIKLQSWPTPRATGEGSSGNPGGPCELVEVAVVYGYEPVTPVLGSILNDVIELTGQNRKLNEPWKPCDD